MNEQAFTEMKFDVGDTLFKEGDEGDEAYLIKSGSIKISMLVKNDQQRTIATVGKGNVVGEMALIDGAPRAATAICVDPVTVIVINNDTLQKRLEGTDPVVKQLLNTFTRRLREQAITLAEFKPF